jgi:hypothetical protein
LSFDPPQAFQVRCFDIGFNGEGFTRHY